MKRASPEVWNIVDNVVVGLGCEFVGARYGQEDGGMVLRVFIDTKNGVTVDNCAEVSHQLSAVLDVENLLDTAYALEVSSPGLERPLFDEKDYVRFSGAMVRLKLLVPQEGRRRFKGRLLGCKNNEIEIEVDGNLHYISVMGIDQANLVLPTRVCKD
jgi:ribosome maturation factor RimP